MTLRRANWFDHTTVSIKDDNIHAFKVFLLLILSSFYSLAQGQDPKTLPALQEGLRVNEAFINFLLTHECETGAKKDCARPMSAQNIETLKSLLDDLGDWKKSVFDRFVPQNDPLQGMSFKLILGPELKITEKKTLSEHYLIITYNPNERASQEFLQDIRVISATNLVIYDNFFRFIKIYAKAKNLRSILKNQLPEHRNILYETYAQVIQKKTWDKIKQSVRFLKAEKALNPTFNANELDQYIEGSFTSTRMKENDPHFEFRSLLSLKEIVSQINFFEEIDKITAHFSKIFGNIVGSIQTRDGKLKPLASNPEFMKEMKKKFKPLDIFLEKTPFRLTDKFIPGYYGHVAIWLGTPEELMEMTVKYNGKEIPLLDHPKVLPYLEKMSQGKLIVEALREPGVTLNTLEHFMDIDDFLVIKSSKKEMSPGEHILKALEQVGKPYDFNFDVDTEDALVCSELVYTVFSDMRWPVDRSMGRYTISPDHVAWRTKDYCFTPKIMYVDGKEITSNLEAELERVLTLPGRLKYTPSPECQ